MPALYASPKGRSSYVRHPGTLRQCISEVLPEGCSHVLLCRPRAVFQAWAEDLAGRFGYSVTFSGIGGAEEEQRVLQAPAWPRSEADVGSATQACPSLGLLNLICCINALCMPCPVIEVFELFEMSRLLQDSLASGWKIERTDSQNKPAVGCHRMHNDCMSWGGYEQGVDVKCVSQVAVFVHSG